MRLRRKLAAIDPNSSTTGWGGLFGPLGAGAEGALRARHDNTASAALRGAGGSLLGGTVGYVGGTGIGAGIGAGIGTLVGGSRGMGRGALLGGHAGGALGGVVGSVYGARKGLQSAAEAEKIPLAKTSAMLWDAFFSELSAIQYDQV